MPLLDQSLVLNQTGHLAYHEGEAERLLDLAINVKRDFDAAGDGATDDSGAIQSALDAAGGAGGGIVYLPGGAYLIERALYVPSGVTVQGAGKAVSSLVAGGSWPNSGPSGFALLVAGPSVDNFYTPASHGTSISIYDLTIDGTAQNPAGVFSSLGISMLYMDYSRVERCRIVGCASHGIFVGGQQGEIAINYSVNAKSPVVRDCIFENNGRFGGQDQLGGGFVTDPLYVGNLFLDSNGTAIDNVFVEGGVWAFNASRDNDSGKGGFWSDCGSSGLKIVDNTLIKASINIWGYLGGTLVGAPQDILIQGNEIRFAPSGAILLGAGNQSGADSRVSRGNRVCDNTIYGSVTNAIFFDTVLNSVISGNRFFEWNTSDASGDDAGCIRLGSNGSPSSTQNRIEGNSFTPVGGPTATQLVAYDETASGKTGGNVFCDNTFGHPSMSWIIDTGTTVRTIVRNLAGWEAAATSPSGWPAGAGTPVLPASDAAFVNNTGYDAMITLIGGTVSAVYVNNQGGFATGSQIFLRAGNTIKLTYSVAPTWFWVPLV